MGASLELEPHGVFINPRSSHPRATRKPRGRHTEAMRSFGESTWSSSQNVPIAGRIPSPPYFYSSKVCLAPGPPAGKTSTPFGGVEAFLSGGPGIPRRGGSGLLSGRPGGVEESGADAHPAWPPPTPI